MPRFLLNGTLSLLFTGGQRGKMRPPPCPLQARLREWASHSPSTALTHPLPPLLQLSVLESALGLDKPFPLQMSEQTEEGTPDFLACEHRVCANSPVEETCPHLPPQVSLSAPAELKRNPGVPPAFPQENGPQTCMRDHCRI